MSRAERLLQLIQCLRRRRLAVRGQALAQELDVSLRTLYRDIASLRAQGAPIDGDPGVGYRLRPGFTLPPLTFSQEEIEALVLGSRWVADRADPELSAAAREALAKIAAVLPPALCRELETSALLVVPNLPKSERGDRDLAVLRRAIRAQRKLQIRYRSLKEKDSERIVWPFALGFLDSVRILVAWCEQRGAFRHFRCDRIGQLSVLEARYPRSREALLAQWRQAEGIATPQ